MWCNANAYKDKRRAKREANMLRAPGKHKTRARVVKEICWRVKYWHDWGETNERSID